MYLKRLDLQGFKSFPEKVKLEFNPGVTAVVGPNGSGKSNVSDAVRWVLGEQRARSLRGDKMEDIIFAGTENRKPLGFAEVSILIDNQDGRLPLAYSEVQVTRRVFRSGESEYRINGTACRLKDIQELFMDTGVGREGYSITGQGRIDEILSAKGEERRRIFEEAAGIVKYKTRKNEAVNKLEKEQQNLLRVDDIISELEVQVEPLEKQSEKAREYLRLKERLKQAEMTAFCRDAARIAKETEMLLQAEETAAEQLAQSLAKSNLEKAQAAFFREKNEELDALLQQQYHQDGAGIRIGFGNGRRVTVAWQVTLRTRYLVAYVVGGCFQIHRQLKFYRNTALSLLAGTRQGTDTRNTVDVLLQRFRNLILNNFCIRSRITAGHGDNRVIH